MRVFWLTLSTLLAFARARPWEPLLIGFSISVAAAGLTAVSLINDSAEQSSAASQSNWTRPYLTVTAKSNAPPLTVADYALLRRAGFDELIAITRVERNLTCGSASGKNMDVVAVDSVGAFKHQQINGQRIGPQNRVTPPASGIAMAPATLSALGCTNKTLTLDAKHTLPQATPLPALPYGVIVMDMDVFYALYSMTSSPLSELVVPDAISNQRSAALRDTLPSHLRVSTLPALSGNAQMSESFRLNLWAMGALMAIVSLFIVINALNLMYRARLPSLVRLRQSGIGSGVLSAALGTELALYTGVGSLLGVATGAWLTLNFTPAIATTFSSLFSLSYIESQPAILGLVIKAWGISMIALLAFMVIPVARLTRLLTFNSARPRRALPLWPGLVALSIALLAPAFAFNSISALIVVGISLICGCVCILAWLPPLLAALARHVPRNWPVFHYSAASAVQLSHRTRLAVCAFFTALAANIAMNVMTDSFRQATYEWVSQRLSADAYLYTSTMPDALNAPDTLTLTPVYRRDIEVDGRPARARSYPFTPRAQQGLVTDIASPNAWQQFTQGRGVFINQQLAFRRALSVGDRVAIALPEAVTAPYRVVGIYPDYGNPDSQVLLPVSRLASPENFSGVISVVKNQGSTPDQLARWTATLPGDTDFYSANALLTLSMEAFDRTFVITRSLNIATLSVAAISFLLAIITVSMDIRPQLALLRSLGLGSLAIHFALFAQYLLLCLGTAILSVPAGIGLSWVFIYKVNRFAFDWVYPLQVDPGVLLSSTLFSVGAILLVLLLPLTRLRTRIDLRQEVTL